MATAVTAKRALWLRHWSADSSSKQALCGIPFNGKALFGDALEEAIKRVTGGKSGLLPQGGRHSGPAFRPGRTSQRFREAKSYRPGRPFSCSSWKAAQPSLL